MVDTNGKQTITNDGATVMKVGFLGATVQLAYVGLPLLIIAFTGGYSFSILFTLPLVFLRISRVPKMLKSVTVPPLLSCWRARYSRRSAISLNKVSVRRPLSRV